MSFNISCPIPINDYPRVLLAHGGGGKLMNNLIEKMFISAFGRNDDVSHDSSVLEAKGKKLAFTTDSYVVHPLFFPGGDIGSMAVYGTVNDLAMSGAKPEYISVSFIIEEGFEMDKLWNIVQSIKKAADNSEVRIVTGDTKVVDKGKGDGIFINTSGIGFLDDKTNINPKEVKDGDAVIVSGDLGRHGMVIMSQREGLSFESNIESDSAPVNHIVDAVLSAGIDVHCMRDLTRGGLASALNEIASSSELGINIDENSIPVKEEVNNICEILGFDPIYVANEGRFAVFVPEKESGKVIDTMNKFEESKNASIIGKVSTNNPGIVTMKSKIGVDRIVDMISGEQLPRIC